MFHPLANFEAVEPAHGRALSLKPPFRLTEQVFSTP